MANKDIKILVSVISIDDPKNERWAIEKKTANLHYKDLNYHLIQCSEKPNTEHIKNYNCKESYTPGIFQKTVLHIEEYLNEYDYFIRTNMNCFISGKRLKSYLQNLEESNSGMYEGVYCSPNIKHSVNFVGGYGVILDKKSARIIVKEGLKDHNFNDTSIADDVLLARILKKHNILCHPPKSNLCYVWDKEKSIEDNLNFIKEKEHKCFVRLGWKLTPVEQNIIYKKLNELF